SSINNEWASHLEERENKSLAPLDENTIPIFLQINPDLLKTADFELLKKYKIEIISEEDDGFIIGASLDHLRTLKDKIEGFADKVHGTGEISNLWEIVEGNRELWKPQHILSPELLEKWPTVENDLLYVVQV